MSQSYPLKNTLLFGLLISISIDSAISGHITVVINAN